MKKDWILTQETFDLLLGWLSSDKNKAGTIYEQLRNGLIRLFLIRGCNNPESLADETINRVTFKLPSLINKYEGNPIHYFYGIANNIYLESQSPRQQRETQLDVLAHSRMHFVPSSKEDEMSKRYNNPHY